MASPLRLLMIEDSPRDELLLIRELTRGGYAVSHVRVETAAALLEALEREPWDLVISDYALPSFDGPRALALVRDRWMDLPFIIVSGTVDEVTAVVAMRAGANDFIAKDKLARLVPAVEREIREAAGRAERRQMQEQLLVSDRMASLGTLAAGVAHEINNPLAAVLGNIDVVIADLEELATDVSAAASSSAVDVVARLRNALEVLGESREAAMRVRDVTQDLKIFSRGGNERRTTIDVRRVLDSSLRLAHNEVRHRARVVREYQEVPPVTANETRLGQVFVNLIVNAAQAMPEGAASQHEIRVTASSIGEHVVIAVTDNGRGIPPDVLAHVFDPFFTTKPIGVGTGLGLAICHRLVTELGGEITVESTVGVGTTLRVQLPAARGSVEPVEAASSGRPVVMRRGRILVVDDDEHVLRALERVLSSYHDVSATMSAADALDRIVAGETFDLVLCDVHMPNMTGRDFHDALTRLEPDHAARVVFMTGGAFTADAREFLEGMKRPFLEKPFDATTLLSLVASRLP